MRSFSLCTEDRIYYLGREFGNDLYVLREDLIPYSFGGNKARKGMLFFDEIDNGDYDCVVTYGSSHSNHCRIIANLAKERKMDCYIIGPDSISNATYNSRLMELFGANIKLVPVECVKDTIDDLLQELVKKGKKPYFVPGGGHGNVGTRAYEECYNEIREYENKKHEFFDYIFFASGTGTTHAGLVSGKIIHGDDKKIVGISIARKNPRGREVVLSSIKEYLPSVKSELVEENTIFIDKYIGEGYGGGFKEINEIIKYMMCQYGIPLDSTYTGKAIYGMKEYLKDNNVLGKRILFIHTGGTPLFFDDLNEL